MALAPQKYQPGSDQDFDALYRETYPRLVQTVGVMMGDWAEAEDCVQEAYARAYRAWPRWRPDAPAEAWMWRIAMNVTNSRLRQRKLRTVGEVLRRFGRPVSRPDPADVAANSDLDKAMRNLKPQEASCVVLRHVHGYTNVEIADVMGVNVRTITRLLDRGTTSLRSQLGDVWRTTTPVATVEEGA
jgi:RNA polymerase sigma-70 factor (ECF subfamily)